MQKQCPDPRALHAVQAAVNQISSFNGCGPVSAADIFSQVFNDKTQPLRHEGVVFLFPWVLTALLSKEAISDKST